jgi:hypothetical protein
MKTIAVWLLYLDVDPPRDERKRLGIPTDTNEPFIIGTPPNAAFAYWEFHQVHAKREELWIQRMMGARVQGGSHDLWIFPRVEFHFSASVCEVHLENSDIRETRYLK